MRGSKRDSQRMAAQLEVGPGSASPAGRRAEIVRQVQQREIATLVLESRQDDSDDERVIVRTREPEPPPVFEHRTGRLERMLWIADAVTWAVGSGHAWAQRLDAMLTDVIELRP